MQAIEAETRLGHERLVPGFQTPQPCAGGDKQGAFQRPDERQQGRASVDVFKKEKRRVGERLWVSENGFGESSPGKRPVEA